MIKYADLGENKKLNEIVMAGSHDAGITGGGSNVQTQNLDIAGQAAAGVRIFDLRIAAATGDNHGLGKEVELKAFHADSKLMKNEQKSRYMPDLGRQVLVTRTKLKGGAFGLGLNGMLEQARTFVTDNPTEFLIFKFDKCTNWLHIAEMCVKTLGNTIYKGTANINTASLRDLKGKVICAFMGDGYTSLLQQYKNGGGIVGIKNLQAGGAYDAGYCGIQYWGKGGTSPFKVYENKLKANESKQRKLMKAGMAAGNPEVMGMMYWTSTGLMESIQTRNAGMWSRQNANKLRTMWREGLGDAIQDRISSSVDPSSYASGGVLKAFMPNFVMIDFADAAKCREIYDLNTVAAVDITATVNELKRLQGLLDKLPNQGRIA